jgi:hypothetical protein
MAKIIELFYSVSAFAQQKSIAIPVAQTPNAEIVAAFKSLSEFQNTLYGAAALFVGRELYAWWKESRNKTTERLDRIEKIVHRLEIIAELEDKRAKK